MKLVDMEALKYFYAKLEQIFSGVTVTIKPQNFTDEEKAQARANIGAGSADFTGDYNDLINKPTVAGQSSIDAGKTIKSWSETDGVVAITTQDISIKKEQISDFAHTHTVEDITDLDGMNFATEQYVSDAIAELPSPMVFKGSLGTDGTITTLPNAVKANTGFTYKVITDNTYSGQKAEAGDMFISDGSKWVYIPSADEKGGVTSVNVSVPTGLSVDGVPITTSGTIAISMEEGYSIPTDAKQGQWDAAYTHSESAHARVDATKVEASETNGNIKIDGVETTVYEHPTQLAKTSDMYKIAVDDTGHVSNAVQATASDLAFDGTVSEVDATNVQDAIDGILEDIAGGDLVHTDRKIADITLENDIEANDLSDAIIPVFTKEQFQELKNVIKPNTKFIISDDEEEGSGSSDGFNYPDEIAFPGDQLYVKEVGADGKPTKWSYMKSEPIMVYDTEERTDYIVDEDLVGYNFLDSTGKVAHSFYRSDESTLTIDKVEYDLSVEPVMFGSENSKNYMVVKKTGNDVTVYRYIDGKQSGSATLEILTDPLAPIMDKDISELTYDEIAMIVRGGRAEEKFKIGDQIVTTYTATNGTQYEMPFDVVAFRESELEDGSIVPGMIIQSHYATVEDLQFDAKEPSSSNSDVKNYGWNRWSYSGLRQWLNSAANAGQWWTSTHTGDVAPDAHGTYNGFMKGFSSDFLNMLKPTKHETALNYIYPSGSANTYVYDTTYDMFFLPSMTEEHFCWTQYPTYWDGSGREGTDWEYWIQRKGSAPQDYGSSYANTNAIRYSLSDKSTAKRVWVRSANRYYSYYEFSVNTTGYMNNYVSGNSYGSAPACVIC